MKSPNRTLKQDSEIEPPASAPTRTLYRELAEYAAFKVFKAEIDQRNENDGENSWSYWDLAGTFDYEWSRWTGDLQAAGGKPFPQRYHAAYPDAEQKLREIAQGDPWLERLVWLWDSNTNLGFRAAKSFYAYIANPRRYTSAPTDLQKQRVYNCEYPLRPRYELGSPEATEAFILSVAKSDWWQAHTVRKGHLPTVVWRAQAKRKLADGTVVNKFANSIAHATWRTQTIVMRENWTWNKIVALHELAHLIASSDEEHGALFTAIFAELVERFVDKEASTALVDAYAQHGVKVATHVSLLKFWAKRAMFGRDARMADDELSLRPRAAIQRAASRSR